MVDRIPLFPDDDTYPGYTPTEFETVTPDEYRAGQVNYFTQVLGPETASLEEETGIEVTKAPDVDGEETREEDPSSKIPDAILGATRPTLDGGVSEAYEISFDIPDIGGSYSDYLKSANKTDRLSLVENIFEPGFDPDASMELGKGISGAFKEGAERVKAFPDKLKSPDAKARTGITGLAAATGLIPGAIVSGLLGGTRVKNAFNKNSFRPPGLLGGIADMVHSKQYGDMQAIRAARIANPYGDTGFAMSLGGFGVTRAPGSRVYTGNTGGMDIETLTSLEAISKGYDPIKGRYNALDPSKSQTVVASGGIQVSNNPMDGFIRANGTVYDPRFIGAGASAAYARRDMIEKAARSFGISGDEMSDAVAVARSGRMTVSQAVQQIQFKNARAVQQQKIAAYNQQKQEQQRAGQQLTIAQARPGEMPQSEAAAKAQREDSGDEGFDYSSAGVDDEGDAAPDYDSSGLTSWALGGRIGLAMGGAPGMASGFVERPPSQVPEGETVADDKKTQLPEGAFVINAAAAEFMGTNDVRTMLLDAHKEALRQGLAVDKQGNGAKLIDVAISRGEVVVAPHLAKIIGYDRLTKINNRGKPETRERIEENGQAPAPATMQAATGMLVSGQMVNPTLTQQDLREQGFLSKEYAPMPDTPIPSRDEDTFFGYTVGELKKAIKDVEIKGFEKDPYIITGAARGKNKSSAFGPMQVTYSTLEDFQKRSPEYKLLDNDKKEYVNDLIQQGRDVVNYQKFGAVYRNGKRQKVSKEQAKNLKAYGSGTIDRARHEEHYDVVADMVLRLKLSDHENIKDALASYGEGPAYANKVLKGLE